MTEIPETAVAASVGGPGGDTDAYEPRKDPNRKVKSKDPGWKYGFWPTEDKDLVECILCGKQVHSGIKRLKQHLIGGYGDAQKCPKTTTAIMREMQEWMKKTSRKTHINLDDEDEDEAAACQVEDQHDENQETSSRASCGATPSPTTSVSIASSGTVAKRKAATAPTLFKKLPPKAAKTIPQLFFKTPEEVVRARHSKGPTQITIEQSSKSKEVQSTFKFIHTKKRNRLLHKNLDMVYIQYNTKIASRFQRLRQEGGNSNPLILEDFQWENEWINKDAEQVHPNEDDLLWMMLMRPSVHH